MVINTHSSPKMAMVYVKFAAANNLNRKKQTIWEIINNYTPLKRSERNILINIDCDRKVRRGVEVYVPVFVTGVNEWVVDRACNEIRGIVGRKNFEWNIDERYLCPSSQKAIPCEEKNIQETIFIKSFATRNLNSNHARKVKSHILNSLKVNYSLSHKTTASDGETYVPFHLTGKSKTRILEAVVLIQDVVGKDNIEMEIELLTNDNEREEEKKEDEKKELPPPTNTQQASSTKKQEARIEQKFYLQPSQSNLLTGKQGRKKKKWIINKSGVENIQVDIPSVPCSVYVVHITGSRQAVRKAYALILEAVERENAKDVHVGIDQPLVSPPTQTPSMAVASDTNTKPQTNKKKPFILFGASNLRHKAMEEESVKEATTSESFKSSTAISVEEEAVLPNNQLQVAKNDDYNQLPLVDEEDDGCVSEDVESNTSVPETPHQSETVNDNNLTKEVAAAEPPTRVMAVQKEEVPCEISNSTRGIALETTMETSISSFNDGSRASTTPPTADPIENDPLLIFLQSQHQCVKGSVDDFYTWLVKSEDIDSMIALKEAVNEDEYLNTKIKKGNGSSGLKGFKVPPFKRAVLEYFNDKSNTKPADEGSNTKIPAAGLDEPPDELVCPISLVLMTNDPVVAADGITYERESIEDWFQKSTAKYYEAQEKINQNSHNEVDQRIVSNGVCSPVHGKKMKNLTLVPNISMRNMARAYKEKTAGGSGTV